MAHAVGTSITLSIASLVCRKISLYPSFPVLHSFGGVSVSFLWVPSKTVPGFVRPSLEMIQERILPLEVTCRRWCFGKEISLLETFYRLMYKWKTSKVGKLPALFRTSVGLQKSPGIMCSSKVRESSKSGFPLLVRAVFEFTWGDTHSFRHRSNNVRRGKLGDVLTDKPNPLLVDVAKLFRRKCEFSNSFRKVGSVLLIENSTKFPGSSVLCHSLQLPIAIRIIPPMQLLGKYFERHLLMTEFWVISLTRFVLLLLL